MKKGYFILFFLSKLVSAEEMNFSKLFSDFESGSNSSQRVIEERLEQDISKFRSVEASRVILPLGQIQSQESLWGVADPRVVSVDVVLKLKKRKRLTFNEFRGIADLVSSSLSENNRVIQINIKDEEGFRWSDENEESKSFFKASEIEQEIQSYVKDQSPKGIVWTYINVSEKDFSCLVEGRYELHRSNCLEARKDLMSFLGEYCSSSKVKILPSVFNARNDNKESIFIWGERASFVLVGFAFCGFIIRLSKKRNGFKEINKNFHNQEDAIILTKIVDRSPDEAAKWMVQELMSDTVRDKKSEIEKNNANSRIIDDSL